MDRWLLATLLPAYLLLQAAGIHGHLASGAHTLPFSLTGAQGRDGLPLVLRARGEAMQRGDRVRRLGSLDVQGLSRAETLYRARPLLRAGEPFDVLVERGAARVAVRVVPAANPHWWWTMPVWASLAATALFLFVRARHWRLRRRFFAAALAACCGGVGWSDPAFPPILNFFARVVAQSLAFGLTLWVAFDWTEAARPGPWARGLAWAIGLAQAASTATWSILTLPVGLFSPFVGSFLAPLAVAGMLRSYRRADPLERRQLRWVVFGFGVGTLPRAAAVLAGQLAPAANLEPWSQLSWFFLVAFPLGIAISVVGYRWLDIDRVISASATATLLGIAVVGGALAVLPSLARVASAPLGFDPEVGRLLLSMALAALLVPAYRVLHPWFDRKLFAARHERALHFEHLRASLAACHGIEELTARAGQGIDALLRPDSIATYARSGDAFTPVFVRGRAAPPAFQTSSTLVQVLEASGKPLSARAREIGPFERAALDTLGAEVVVPVRRGDQLLAFTCLAGQHSGDIYTASDLALLSALSERCSEVIARLDADQIAREARTLQAALRRYVPGAVADRVLAGDLLAPAEREVSVLFVDIRDYTRATQALRPAEVFATLNEHTERVSRIVQSCGGTIVEFNGDGMMAVLGAPEPLAEKERLAVEAARRIVDSMPAGLAAGVGIATGPAFVGSIRSSDRLIWSAVGSTTNLASRLQSLTRALSASIAIDETTRTRAGYVCADFARHADVAIRGRVDHLDVFVLPLRDGAAHREVPHSG